MKIRFIKAPWDSVESDALIVPIFQNEDLSQGLAASIDRKLGGLLSELKASEEWQGRAGEINVLYKPVSLKAGRLVLLGAGKREKYDPAAIRNLLSQAVRRLKSSRMKQITVYRRSGLEPALAAQAAAEGIVLATYDGDDYKTEDRSKTFIEEVLLATDQDLDPTQVEAAIERGRILAEATNAARRLVNEPANRVNPQVLAEKARQAAEACGLEIEVLSVAEMKERKMNAILAVAQGSDNPAQFIVLRHAGAGSEEKPIVFIGKGVTFDSGGLSLKPAQSMEEMKCDKAGACAVLGALQAIAKLGVKRNVVGLIPAVENLPGGKAQRPGDVIESMSGKTIEVVNTDAEGRLILADALHYAAGLQPRYIIDIATLTGACVVALGHIRAGLFCNNEALYESILRVSDRTGEKFWRLPLDEDYRREIKSEIADIKNVGSRWGGAITAAKFLQEFVGETPWCHLDIAGVDLFKDAPEGKGATGFGVRTLAELAML